MWSRLAVIASTVGMPKSGISKRLTLARLVVTHEMALRATRTVLRQIDKVPNADAKQVLDNVNLIVGCDRMPVGIGAGGKLAGDDPVGAIRWARGHRPDRGPRPSLGQACQP